MTQVTPDEIAHLADLARLSLSEAETAKFANELPAILDFVDQVSRADVGELSSHQATPLAELRDDVPGSDALTLEQLEQLAKPNWRDDHVEVPAVFGEGHDA